MSTPVRIKGERYFTVHVLVGDVIQVQPDAYDEVTFRVSARKEGFWDWRS